ncbi:MAG TPA: nuclear transport factor 2 family protein [Herbaspirillum sp.]|jgi:ketosteroid isomerase-like protein
MHPNAQLIEVFYTAMQARDAETMAACYAPGVHFSDPVFTSLDGDQAADMWRMLLSRAKDFDVRFDSIAADDRSGVAHWVARYTFSATGRSVVNDIHAYFDFADGKIVRHADRFELWRWARQALGAKGLLLGWAPPVQQAIRKQAAAGLAAFRAKAGR